MIEHSRTLQTYNIPRPSRTHRFVLFLSPILRFQKIVAGSRASTTSAAIFSAKESVSQRARTLRCELHTRNEQGKVLLNLRIPALTCNVVVP